MQLDYREKRRVILNILGVNYPILTDESDATMRQIEQLLGDLIEGIKTTNPQISNTTAMVLACLNLSEELYRIKDELDRYKEQGEDYLELSEYKAQLEEAVKKREESEANFVMVAEKCQHLDEENDELRDLIEEYEMKFSELRSENELNKRTITELQNKLVENQLELMKTRKSFLDFGN